MPIMTCSITYVLVFVSLCVIIVVQADMILREDPLALLSATLRTYQKAACDTDQVVIACPRGTSISIEFAQYNNFGNKGDFDIDELCPLDKSAKHLQVRAKNFISGSTPAPRTSKTPSIRPATKNRYNPIIPFTEIPNTSSKTEPAVGGDIEDNTSRSENSSSISTYGDASSENCMWPNALQYSLLQTVVEACQKKKHCKFHGASHYYKLTEDAGNYNATASDVSMDPCHKRPKIVELAYKCRPYEFRSKVACHNDVAQLECNPYSRIAVYSANFGRTEYESIQCPQPQGVREETCQASYTTETVMQICHGRRRCNLAADANTFGSPCQPNSRMYLKVVYTCVPKQVLKDRYESEIEGDETKEFEGDNEVYDDELNYEAIPKVYNNSTVIFTRTSGENLSTTSSLNAINANISFHLQIPDSINAVKTHNIDLNLEEGQERLYLYLLILGLGGIVVCITAVSAHVLLQRHQAISLEAQMSHINSSTSVCMNTTISNGYNDALSDIDAEINIPKTISVAPNVKNENYIMYGLNSGLYSHRGPSNRLKNSSALPLQGSSSIHSSEALVGSVSSTINTNSEICSTGQSPDVIGISKKSYKPVATSDVGQVYFRDILPPPTAIGDKGDTSSTSLNCGTGVPITSLGQCSSTPTVRAAYVPKSEGFFKRNVQTPTMATSTGSNQLSAPSELSSINTSAFSPILQQQLSYDGTEARTLSTGIPVNSQFYYG